jgi:flavin-dependent dehydrogenase
MKLGTTAFIDPFFSSGVHLAMTSGLSAAASISASIRGDCPESEAAEWHSQRVGVSYTRYALSFCSLSAYPSPWAQFPYSRLKRIQTNTCAIEECTLRCW